MQTISRSVCSLCFLFELICHREKSDSNRAIYQTLHRSQTKSVNMAACHKFSCLVNIFRPVKIYLICSLYIRWAFYRSMSPPAFPSFCSCTCPCSDGTPSWKPGCPRTLCYSRLRLCRRHIVGLNIESMFCEIVMDSSFFDFESCSYLYALLLYWKKVIYLSDISISTQLVKNWSNWVFPLHGGSQQCALFCVKRVGLYEQTAEWKQFLWAPIF